MKILVNLLCCFIPNKKIRKKIRHQLVVIRERRKELLSHGFKIEDGIITTPQGVNINISSNSDDPLYVVKEVFLESDYNLSLNKDSVLIDIGMNRAVASLFFATNEHIKKIYAYEPFKPTAEIAKRNIKLNPKLAKKINAFNWGLGRTDKILELPYLDSASGCMSTTHNVCGLEVVKRETVCIRDAAAEIFQIIDQNKDKKILVKCDCEGAEYEIFERLNEKNILNRLDVIIMEYHFEKPDKLISILVSNGFAVQTRDRSSRRRILGYIYAVRMND